MATDLLAAAPTSSSAACCTPVTGAPMTAQDAERTARTLKALADPARLRLLSILAAHEGGEACVCDLTPAFDLTGPTISHHLKTLREAGLVDAERRGTWVYYRARPQILRQLAGLLSIEPTAAAQR